MIEVYELLRSKENELARVRTEIEALRIVAALLPQLDDIPDVPLRLVCSSGSSPCRRKYPTRHVFVRL